MITIITRLHDGIYRSDGGGERREYDRWKASPRGLFAAVREVAKHRATMVRCFGNVGCGTSWIEVDGRVLSRDDEDAIVLAAEMAEHAPIRTAERECADVLARMAQEVAQEVAHA